MEKHRARYNVALVLEDMSKRGWNSSDLAREAGISAMTVSRFLAGEAQTAPTAKAIAVALGYKTPRRYFSHVEAVA